LGHTISIDGIYIDPSKVQKVMDWKPPTSVHQICSFLGLAGYYRRFILDFSKIAKPMTELLKKGVKFSWNEKCEEAFHTLRAHLTTAPVLAQPDNSKPFDVYCDVSGIGLCCVLMQNNQVIAYASRALRTHEQNYHEHSGLMNRTILPMILSLQPLSIRLRSGDIILWVLSATFTLTIRVSSTFLHKQI
jgi:hypothetical protein